METKMPSDKAEPEPSDAVPPAASDAERAPMAMGVIAMGLGRFRVLTEHEHRLALEREDRLRP